MKIETKYDIGQEVWFNMLDAIKAEIVAITIHDNYVMYHVETKGRGRSNFTTALRDDIIFPSKEELLKSL